MIPDQWAPPCNTQCTHKYAALMQIPSYCDAKSFQKIPGRVFCKKGCDADGETWDECLGECDEICYKDPVLKDKQWSAYIDRSPGSATYSEECFRACVAGCGYKFDIPSEIINQVHSRPPKPPEEKPRQSNAESQTPPIPTPTEGEIPCTSA